MRIKSAVLGELVAHAREVAPLECCGLLLGANGVIERSIRARNLHASPVRYLISPDDHFRAIREARLAAMEVLGAYHSHPRSPAVPSPSDMSEAADRALLYIIVSPGGFEQSPDIRAYRIDRGNFSEEILVPEA